MSETQQKTKSEELRNAAVASGPVVGEVSSDPQYSAVLERRLRELSVSPDSEKAKDEALGAVSVAYAIKYLKENAKTIGDSATDRKSKVKELITERLNALREKKETILNSILQQVKPLETVWRGLSLAYRNSMNAEGKGAKFFLVSASKEALIEESELSKGVSGTDQRRKQPLIETLLRDGADRFGASPYSLVVLPFQIEAEDANFFRGLGRLGRRYRSPIISSLGPSLLRLERFPVSGDQIKGALEDSKNTDWKSLVSAENSEDAESLSYLSLVTPRIAGRLPYQFQRELKEMQGDDTLYREGVVWVPAAYAFAGKIDNLGGRSVHLMPAGKSFGRVELEFTVGSDNKRYATIPRDKAPRHFPLEADLLISNADGLWESGLITVVRWDDTGAVNFYGDPTLLTDRSRLEDGEAMVSLGVRLTHDHILHYCNRYLYSKIGEPVTDDLANKVASDLKSFLNRNSGNAVDRPLKDGGFEVSARVNPDNAAELLVEISIDVKQGLRKVQVSMKVKKDGLEEIK